MKQIISSEAAPKALGPYSQAVRVERLLFLSGQVAIDPATGELVGDDAATQVAQVMRNLAAVLQAAGGSLADLVKTTIYLTDLDAFAEVNRVYGSHFASQPPARATVEVARLPKGALVEIDGIAVLEPNE